MSPTENVQAGTSAPALGQPGSGSTQYLLHNRFNDYVNGANPAFKRVLVFGTYSKERIK
jgi:hypothetical protein